MTRERWACWVPWLVGSVIGLFAEQLVDVVGEARAAGIYGLAGIALGWTWYWLYPRPLLDRMRLAGVAVLAGSTFAIVFGGEVSHPTVRSMIGVGVFAGLVLAEARSADARWTPGPGGPPLPASSDVG